MGGAQEGNSDNQHKGCPGGAKRRQNGARCSAPGAIYSSFSAPQAENRQAFAAPALRPRGNRRECFSFKVIKIAQTALSGKRSL